VRDKLVGHIWSSRVGRLQSQDAAMRSKVGSIAWGKKEEEDAKKRERANGRTSVVANYRFSCRAS